jgi:aryl-alcohol dehydrogenase-like predicted oxidoreductase
LKTMKSTYKSDSYASDFPGKGSRLVYGTSGLGGVWGVVDPGESVDCLLYAFENGITTVDTSPSYSNSETYVGQALRRWTGTSPFISTKVGRLPRVAHGRWRSRATWQSLSVWFPG